MLVIVVAGMLTIGPFVSLTPLIFTSCRLWAAALKQTQVLHIAHDGDTPSEHRAQQEESQRGAFLRELEAMVRLRSPNTVNVYGAVTSLPDRMILVMELLAGGDLQALLRKSEQPLPVKQSRRIIGDICTGMAFLHSKNTVHGDLKSANVLLDGDGRAKVIVCGWSWIVLSKFVTAARFRAVCFWTAS